MTNAIGHKRWAIAEGYIPQASHGPEPEMTSHETVCLLNTSGQDAQVKITIYFSERDPRLFSQPSGPENSSTGFSDRGRQVSGKAGPMVRLRSIRDTGLSPSGRVWGSRVQTDNLKRTRREPETVGVADRRFSQ